MKRRLRVSSALLALLLAAFLPARGDAEHSRPSFVVLVADDLGWGDVGFHGSRYRTPNLDRMARDGRELAQHYTAPMCSPTRAALLTGRYWSRFGVTSATNDRCLPFSTVTLASALRSAGYDTALTGKWHLGSLPEWGPRRFGFDHSYGSLAGGVGSYDHRYKSGPFTRTWHRDDVLTEEAGHVTDLIAQAAVRWIEGRRERPFFLYVPFTAVHIPIEEPEEWMQRFRQIADPDERRYAACVAHLDDAVGRILAALERTGRRRGTLVLFSSDNGAPAGARNDDPQYPGTYPAGRSAGGNAPLRGHKGQLYEGGIRVPALAIWPGMLKPGKVHAPLHAVDWMPTLCGLAGAKPSGDLRWDGRDAWPALSGGPDPAARRLYWKGPGGRASAVRDGDWKLVIHRGENSREELFDLRSDPGETTDLAGRRPELAADLRRLMAELSARDDDALPSADGGAARLRP